MMEDTTPGTRGYHHGDLRHALLEAALATLTERGPAGLSLREVARRAGVSHGAPAHHFKDKAGLLTALATQGFERFGAALEQATAAETNAVSAFAATGRAYVHFAVDNRALFELMFRPEHLNRDSPELAEAMERSYQQLLAGVVAAQKEGYVPHLPPEDIALSAWTTVHGLATLWINGNLQAQVHGSLDEVVMRVLSTGADELRG